LAYGYFSCLLSRSELQSQIAASASSLDAAQLAMLQKIAQQNQTAPSSTDQTQQEQRPSNQHHQFDTSSTSNVTSQPASSSDLAPDAAPISTFVPNASIGDLSQFNINEFDPTNASHWLHFAQQWHNTYQVRTAFIHAISVSCPVVESIPDISLLAGPSLCFTPLQYIPSNQELVYAFSEYMSRSEAVMLGIF
jgi:hypothetical protein